MARTSWGVEIADPIWDADALTVFVDAHFPAAAAFGAEVTSIAPGHIWCRLPISVGDLRPGGTVSGPTQMTLVDTAFYYLLLVHLGPEALAVTSNLTFNFLRKPSPDAALLAEARLLKLGRRLAMGDVLLYSEGDAAPVAHAAVTYARASITRSIASA